MQSQGLLAPESRGNGDAGLLAGFYATFLVVGVQLEQFKSFLLGLQDLKVNLCGLQQDKRSDGKGKNNVGIAG